MIIAQYIVPVKMRVIYKHVVFTVADIYTTDYIALGYFIVIHRKSPYDGPYLEIPCDPGGIVLKTIPRDQNHNAWRASINNRT